MFRLTGAAALAGLALLAGCTTPDTGSTRAVSVQSVVGFEPARLAGGWHEVAALGRPSGGRWQVTVGEAGRLAVNSTRDGTGQGRMTGPGRFTLTSFGAPLWVLWADADTRTLVLGTPDRSFAVVLDRAARPSPDRLAAAREILDWNGYELAALE